MLKKKTNCFDTFHTDKNCVIKNNVEIPSEDRNKGATHRSLYHSIIAFVMFICVYGKINVQVSNFTRVCYYYTFQQDVKCYI